MEQSLELVGFGSQLSKLYILMKKLRDYIFYRVYEIATRKGRSVEDAVENLKYSDINCCNI